MITRRLIGQCRPTYSASMRSIAMSALSSKFAGDYHLQITSRTAFTCRHMTTDVTSLCLIFRKTISARRTAAISGARTQGAAAHIVAAYLREGDLSPAICAPSASKPSGGRTSPLTRLCQWVQSELRTLRSCPLSAQRLAPGCDGYRGPPETALRLGGAAGRPCRVMNVGSVAIHRVSQHRSHIRGPR